MQFTKNKLYFVKQIIQVQFHSTKIILYVPWLLGNLFAGTTDCLASQVAPVVKYLPAKAGDARDAGLIPGWGIYPVKEMATLSSKHFSITFQSLCTTS